MLFFVDLLFYLLLVGLDRCIQPKDHQNSVVFDIVYGLSRHVNIDAEELYNHIVENNIEPATRLKLMMDKLVANYNNAINVSTNNKRSQNIHIESLKIKKE
jgi:hypothetical protein